MCALYCFIYHSPGSWRICRWCTSFLDHLQRYTYKPTVRKNARQKECISRCQENVSYNWHVIYSMWGIFLFQSDTERPQERAQQVFKIAILLFSLYIDLWHQKSQHLDKCRCRYSCGFLCNTYQALTNHYKTAHETVKKVMSTLLKGIPY